jgi:hypothetical protein
VAGCRRGRRPAIGAPGFDSKGELA